MSALELTRLQIINQGLALAGRPDLLSDARMWLSLFLEEVYLNQDLPWLEKRVTGIAVANGTEVPFDYRAAQSATMNHPNGSVTPLTSLTKPEEIDQKLRGTSDSQGTPQYFYVDPLDRTFHFISSPDQAYTMDLRYYFVPEIGEVGDDTCDDDVPLWRLPVSILIDHIKARAYEYNDDQRQEAANAGVEKKFMTSKMNNHDRRAGPSRIQLGKRFKKRF